MSFGQRKAAVLCVAVEKNGSRQGTGATGGGDRTTLLSAIARAGRFGKLSDGP